MSGEIQMRNYIKYTMCNITYDPILNNARVTICRVLDMTNRRTVLYYRGSRGSRGYRGNHFCITFTCSVWKSGYKFILF
jgi:hypothetical protein